VAGDYRATARITAASARPPSGGSRTPQPCRAVPPRRSERALGWTRTVSRICPLTGAGRGVLQGPECHRPPLLRNRWDVVLPLCPRRAGQDVGGAGLQGEFGRQPGAGLAAAEPHPARGLERGQPNRPIPGQLSSRNTGQILQIRMPLTASTITRKRSLAATRIIFRTRRQRPVQLANCQKSMTKGW